MRRFANHGGVISSCGLQSKALLARAFRPCYPLAMTDAVSSMPGAPAKAQVRARPKAPWQVWRDAAGRLSLLRIFALAYLLVPVAVAVFDYYTEGFGARPINNVIHRAGYWALIFLMTSLAI